MKNPTKTYKVKIDTSNLTVAIDTTYLPENTVYAQLTDKLAFDVHFHAWQEVFLVWDEPLTLYTERQTKEYTNCVLLIPPMVRHTTIRSADYRMAVTHQRSEKDKAESPLDRFLKSTEPVSIPIPAGLMYYAQEIEKQLAVPDDYSRDRISACLRLIFCEIAAALTPRADKRQSEINETYLETIEQFLVEFQQDINLGTVAKELGLSTRQVSRVIRKNYNATFSEMLCERRLDAAQRLLSHTDIPISEVVERVNFPSESYFYAKFKKRHGQTPQQYRRDHKT